MSLEIKVDWIQNSFCMFQNRIRLFTFIVLSLSFSIYVPSVLEKDRTLSCSFTSVQLWDILQNNCVRHQYLSLMQFEPDIYIQADRDLTADCNTSVFGLHVSFHAEILYSWIWRLLRFSWLVFPYWLKFHEHIKGQLQHLEMAYYGLRHGYVIHPNWYFNIYTFESMYPVQETFLEEK